MKSSTLSVRFNDLDAYMIRKVCELQNVTASDFIRSVVSREVSKYCDPHDCLFEMISQRPST